MRKLITTLLISLPLLTIASAAQAHSPGHGGIRGSISIAVPIGYGGYLAYNMAPYYPAPYYYTAPYGYYNYPDRHRKGYRHESRYGYGNDDRHGGQRGNSHGNNRNHGGRGHN